MDPYDEAQHDQHHPSHSIPNAAYPDSEYRPGQGHAAAAATPSSQHGGVSSSGSFTPQSQASPSIYAPPHVQHEQPGLWPGTVAKPSNLSIPNGPPPPYDPSRTPSSYSPLGAASSSSRQPVTAHLDDIPLQDMTPVSGAGGDSPSHHHYQQQPQLQPQRQQQPGHQLQVPPPPNPGGSGASTVSDKTGPLAAKLRKKRRMKICLLLGIAVLTFITALMIGIGLGVIKGKLHNNDDGHEHGPDHDA